MKGNQTALKFGIPMVWREPANHFDDCYFCMTILAGFNKKTDRALSIRLLLQLNGQSLILMKTLHQFL